MEKAPPMLSAKKVDNLCGKRLMLIECYSIMYMRGVYIGRNILTITALIAIKCQLFSVQVASRNKYRLNDN